MSARELRLLSVVAPMLDEEEIAARVPPRASPRRSRAPVRADRRRRRLDGRHRRDPRRPRRRATSACGSLHLSRNFGHQTALTAGPRARARRRRGDDRRRPAGPAGGDPGDARRAGATGADVVYAVRQRARGRDALQARDRALVLPLVRPAGAGRPRSPTPATSGCSTARALDALLAMPERNRFLRGMTVWVGFTQTAVAVRARRAPRRARRSTRCARCCASRSTRSRRSRTSRCRSATFLGFVVRGARASSPSR